MDRLKHILSIKIALLLLFVFTIQGCTEQYVIQTNTFDDALVIEATITNEFKKQQIKISRTYRFEENGPIPETGAEVYITDETGNRIDFEESNGQYFSASEFEAQPEKSYRLSIVTKDGRTYSSTTEKLPSVNEIQDITTTVKTVQGKRGVSLNVQSYNPEATSGYYRYEYEETYKIVAPYTSAFRATVVPGAVGSTHDDIAVILRDGREITTCYSNALSSDIIQTSTAELSEDRVDFPVRFIGDRDPIIANRYSILVRQYVQNLASYTFYKTLKDLSGSGSILSQNQPGFFYGNMHSNDNPNEKVIGFFDVSSVSSKRVFFNYTDLFPGEPFPPYFVDCLARIYKFCFVPTDPECRGAALLSSIASNQIQYLGDDDLYYTMALTPCVDCTNISSNIKPSFWID